MTHEPLSTSYVVATKFAKMSEGNDYDYHCCQSTDEWLAEELYEYCTSNDISEEGIHQIIERHKLSSPKNNNEVCDYDFFHWACDNENVTVGIIECLLEYFPAAANDVGYGRRVPLHYACACDF